MSKLRPLYVIIPGVLLVVIVVCVFMFVLMPPVREEIASLKGRLETATAKANERDQRERELAAAKADLKDQQAKLDHYIDTRGVHISTYQPVPAMVALWYELQDDLPPAIETFLESTGCTIQSGFALPAPQIQKPTLGPASFMRIPQQGGFSVTVRGTEEQIRDLYTSLGNFDRVATISGLTLQPVGNGDKLDASFTMTIFLLAEGPAAAPAAAAPGGMGAMGGAMGPMGPGAGPGAAPSAAPPSGAPSGGGSKAADEDMGDE
jgi:hypothetical protein